MKTIYFVRHGESEANVQSIRSGSLNDIPLTKKGFDQARKSGETLKDKNIDLIISSGMIRAHDTASIIAEVIGYDPNKIIKEPQFVERSFGIYDGKANDEYLAAKAANKLHKSVETTKVLHQRVSRGLDWLKSLDANHIVLVSHCATGRMVKTINQELEHDQMHTMELLENAEIYEFNL
jgi:uncharacterized phosphatase